MGVLSYPKDIIQSDDRVFLPFSQLLRWGRRKLARSRTFAASPLELLLQCIPMYEIIPVGRHPTEMQEGLLVR